MNMEFQPSKLGTKEHWDGVYEDEVANFEEIGDEGEIWFGTESVEKIVKWALSYAPPASQPSILEIGSGNGSLLFALAEAGYTSTSLTGIDYATGAVKLAKAIAAKKGIDGITFKECNFLEDDLSSTSWDLILDKGTYDAIALGPRDGNGRSQADRYPARLVSCMKPGSYFLITSCNFTEDELRAAFANSGTGLNHHSRIQHAIFTFGGKSGSICASAAFQKPGDI